MNYIPKEEVNALSFFFMGLISIRLIYVAANHVSVNSSMHMHLQVMISCDCQFICTPEAKNFKKNQHPNLQQQ